MTDRTSSALAFISPVDRAVWVSMAMAIKSEYGDSGFDMWDDWSQLAGNYNPRSARSVWKSCKGSGITIATLIHEAKQLGFKDDNTYTKPTREQIEAQRQAAQERASAEGLERARLAAKASKKAEAILTKCKPEQHAYLHKKGFKELEGLVWRPTDGNNILCIPMYVNGNISSLQFISREGEKKFLTDGITSKAEHCFTATGRNAQDWWLEGYATGLSLRECLHALKMPYRIHVCFSANNLQRMAHSGYVIADNDASETGLKSAIATGLPYWMATTLGQDFNDFHKANGTFKTSQEIRRWLKGIEDEKEYYRT